ncbi:MAG: helix-turn-helix transcriptional regulator [Clostridia bacterium]|nr:helix-turn-helix transcriptional regulator [Clostridia bacterium]
MKSLYDDRYKAAISLLKGYRLNSNMTQQELAMLLNSDQGYVSKFESGQRRLDIIEVRTICNHLGVNLVSFVNDLETIIKEENLDD